MTVKTGKYNCSNNENMLIVHPTREPYDKISPIITGISYKNSYSEISTSNIRVYTGLNNTMTSPPYSMQIGDGFIDILTADIDGIPEDEIITLIPNRESNIKIHGHLPFPPWKIYSG
jgi:hypothetical protein